jgi:ATP-dependent Lon protease
VLQRGQSPRGLPAIKSLDDIYRLGVLCQAKVQEDKQNPFSPYMLTMFPLTKAELAECMDPQVGPLARVRVNEVIEESLTEDLLSNKQAIVFKFLKQQYMKCFKVTQDQKFIAYLKFLESNFALEYVQDFVHMVLTCLSLPQYINTYKFLINISKHQVQDIFQESDLGERLEKMNGLFTDFVNKLEIWNKLEEQYDFRADQAKTQKKLEEIYESLKKHFTNEKDEKQEQVKEFLRNLEGKVVPEHIMKTINEEIQRFLNMEKHHSEVQVTRTYLEYLTKMPYGISAPENFDIQLAKQTLD